MSLIGDISAALINGLSSITGITWIVGNQNAPREPTRPYGALFLVSAVPGVFDDAVDLLDNQAPVISASGNTVTVSGDVTASLLPGGFLQLKGTTANDGGYIVESVALSGSDTVVQIIGTLPATTGASGVARFAVAQRCRHIPLTFNLVVYGSDDPARHYEPSSILLNVASRIEQINDALAAANGAVSNVAALTDATVPVDGTIEPRAALSFQILAALSNLANAAILETVDIEQEYRSPDDSVAYSGITTVSGG